MGHLHITRTEHTLVCQECEGGGEVIVNDTNPHGYGPDPQCDEPWPCDACCGTGEVVVWTDPLIRLQRCRKEWPLLFPRYARARRDAMRAVRLPKYAPDDATKAAALSHLHPLFSDMFRQMGLAA